MHYPIRVLFLCTGNSARSQMAEGFLRFFGKQDFIAYSAGSDPKGLNPLAISIMNENGIDISTQRSKHLNEFLEQSFDYLITVCDRAQDSCPIFPGNVQKIHWSYPDPAAVMGSQEKQLQAFRNVAFELREQIRAWVATQRKKLQEQGFIKQAE